MHIKLILYFYVSQLHKYFLMTEIGWIVYVFTKRPFLHNWVNF